MRRWFWLLLLILPSMTLTAQDEITIDLNIAYIRDGNDRHVLDVYLPAADAPHPTIFLVHGGGYIFGSKDMMRLVARHYAQQGYAVVVPNYRLAPQHTYPAQIEDVFCALAWTYDNAETFTFDLGQLFIVGESAGANAGALLATVDDPQQFLDGCPSTLPDEYGFAGVVAFYMPVDLSTCDACELAQQMASAYLGVAESAWQQADQLRSLWEDASPLAWIDDDDPPFLLLHGTADSLIPISESQLFLEAYQAVGGDVSLIALEDVDHGFLANTRLRVTRDALDLADDWLRERLAASQS